MAQIMNKVSHDSEILTEGQQVITACAFVHENFDGIEKVFLPKRAETKRFLSGIFELPGGHIDFGEDIVNGLKREVREEFGMEISVRDPFAVFTYSNDIKKSHSIEVVYFAKFLSPVDDIRVNTEDHSEFKWMSEGELMELTAISPEERENAKKGFTLLK